jgi:hypothetical protein
VLIPAGLVELARQDHERRKTPARRVDTLDSRDLVSITWLYSDCSTYGVRARDNLRRRRNAYYKASLVKVIDVVV